MVKGWLLVPLLAVAALCLVLYTPVILKTPWPEWSPGLGLGILPILGFYFVQAGRYDWAVLVASVPSGILVHNLLLLNEFPDVEADRKGGRRNTPVLFGMEAAGRLFRTATVSVYIWIAGCVIVTIVTGRVVMPVYSLVVFLTLTLCRKGRAGSRAHTPTGRSCAGLGSNVAFNPARADAPGSCLYPGEIFSSDVKARECAKAFLRLRAVPFMPNCFHGIISVSGAIHESPLRDAPPHESADQFDI
jgi:1,4-dihydroxy-2-naphthoate octaprenyltransferase